MRCFCCWGVNLDTISKHRRYIERIDSTADRSRQGLIKHIIHLAVQELERCYRYETVVIVSLVA